MQKKRFREKPLMKFFYKIEDFVTILSLTFIILLTLYNVVLRFIFRTSSLWSDELISFLMLFMAMMGMAIGVKENSHASLENVVCKCPKKLQAVLYIVDGIIVAIFLFTSVFASFQFLETVKGQKMVILRWPMTIMYSFILLGCVLASIEHIINMAEAIKNKECRFMTLEEQFDLEQTFEQRA